MSNDTQVAAHMALVDDLTDNHAFMDNWTYQKARAAVEASARQLAEQRVIDKSELKRLVTQVFGEDFQIVRQAEPGFVMPETLTPQMLDALRVGSRKDWPSDELCRVRYAALLAAARPPSKQPKADHVADASKLVEPCPPADDEAILRQALGALEHHREQTRPIHRTTEAIASLRARLGRRPAIQHVPADDSEGGLP